MSTLLAPVTPTAPCGDDLSFSSEFDHIQELRRADDPTLDQGEWVTALKSADWPEVVKQCDALLSHRTKDLRLLVWRVEALAQMKGYPGLAQGLEDCVQVCEAFWDGLHPLPEDGDMEQRAGSIRWLLAQLQRLARSLPVTSAANGRFTLAQMDEARQLQTAIERDPDHAAALSEGKPTLAQVQRARSDTPAAFLRANVEALALARAQLHGLQTLLDPRLGDEGPSFVHARQALDDAFHAVERLAREAGVITGPGSPDSPEGSPAAANGSPSGSQSGAAKAASLTGEPTDRAQALRQLRMVADFFRRTEPHSPVALLADKAARWGEMPLEQWLREVIKDQGSLGHLEELLGMKPAGEPGA
jgi:type VI secretion system protein ImpA